MSFSQPTKVENPALHHYEWRNGKLSWYKKYDEPDTNGKKGENVDAKLPFEFIVLDELSTITGFSKQADSGIWSNEVRNTTKQPVTVRTFKGNEIAKGLYADIKDTVKAAGGKYTRSIYIAEKVSGTYVISQIKFAGAAFGAWLEFVKNHNPESGKFLLTGSVEGKNGATVYEVPTFKYGNLNEEDIKAATELDKDLQKYLDHYMDTSQLEQDDTVHSDEEFLDSFNNDDGKASADQLAEFERLKASKLKAQPDDAQDVYNRQAIDDTFFTDEPMPDVPPEFL